MKHSIQRHSLQVLTALSLLTVGPQLAAQTATTPAGLARHSAQQLMDGGGPMLIAWPTTDAHTFTSVRSKKS